MMATVLVKTDGRTVEIRQKDWDDVREYVAKLENAIKEMHAAIPGGQICCPQQVADELREIASKVGVDIPD